MQKRPRSELSDLAIGCDRITAKNNSVLARDRIGPTRVGNKSLEVHEGRDVDLFCAETAMLELNSPAMSK